VPFCNFSDFLILIIEELIRNQTGQFLLKLRCHANPELF
jgi:hypothetical protein